MRVFTSRHINPGCRVLTALAIAFLFAKNTSAQTLPFRNSRLPMEARIQDLLARLTVEEKVSLLGFRSKAVPRLGIPAYNWWNEALHGVARAGEATVYPQAIALAATFDAQLAGQVANAISTEARAKNNLATAMDRRLQYMGLTFWSPNINIFRDPRWGRGQETYGEDPFLTATMGTAFVKGMQGRHPKYLKTAACAKHFAVHSGPEAGRHSFNVIVDEKDLRETYLYAFKKLVDAGVESVMCAYNRVNGSPCCTGNELLQNILRNEWRFRGHVVTDCWALEDIWKQHKVMDNSVQVAAAALKAGVNLDCSNMLQDDLVKAFGQGLVSRAEIDTALAGLLRTQFRLGFFDEAKNNPYRHYGADSVHNSAHIQLARKAAQESMVLLKNEKHLLPLAKTLYKSIMVLGPNAATIEPLVGNYHGQSGSMVTFLEGITEAAGAATVVQYSRGCDDVDTAHFGGIWAAGESDIAIAVIGLTPSTEGEEGDAFLSKSRGDKTSLDLPPSHVAFLKALRKKNKPVIVVVTAGSAVNISAIEPYADAIIVAWYPGEQGGHALADIIFGKVSPSGRLPVSFYSSVSDLPPYESYAVSGRTYRYFQGPVPYPFGYGLGYSSFYYDVEKQPLALNAGKDSVVFSMSLKNTGTMDAGEVVQVYVQYPPVERMPLKELKAFRRIDLAKGAGQRVRFSIAISELKKWDQQLHGWRLYPGTYRILAGASSTDIRITEAIYLQ